MLSNAMIKKFLQQIGGLAAGSSCYIGLSTTEPQFDENNAFNITEPSTELGYSRRLFESTPTSGTDTLRGCAMIDENNVLTNTEIIYFGEATGDWGVIPYYCLFSSATKNSSGADLIAYGELDEPINPTANTVPLIRAKAIKITLTAGEK